MTLNSKVIGLIAGQGDLPPQIIDRCQAQGDQIVAIAFENQTPPETVSSIPHIWLKLGAVDALLTYLRSQNVTHIVMAGGIKRPSLSELSLDWTGTKLLAKMGLMSLGDDGVLTAIIKYLEEKGFTVIGADELLDDLLMPQKCLTTVQPSETEMNDIQIARQVLSKLGEADIGQALVIQQGLILGVEAIEGTENLINRVQSYRREGGKPILVKMAKPQQNLKADLPTIGLQTVEQCINNKFAGIAVEAGKTQILKQDEAVALANKEKIFIFGF
ncbi:hypothetical protein ID47_02180 [Candidatus Paracaedibacter acanthamoebae]|uniref:UDP-2,3-diacylglucosamine pyrophosphatase n=2 Tax=Candidatus Odyssella acanthamoebae TaxID=91604 RepID=A0A077ATS6_9PROT|nr:hypothetical protein ID47_02180 [Candidatus Paracaedibacter acanthamoebae]